MMRRLRSTAGETISEVLVGVLIVGLATVLFATMVNVATSTSVKSTDRTQITYGQLSAVDSGGAAGSAATSAATVSLSPGTATSSPVPGFPSQTGVQVAGPNAKFDVSAVVSSPETDSAATYTFTRYELPDAAREGGA